MDVYTAWFDEQLEAIKQADEKEPKMQPTTKIRIILLEDTEAIRDSLAKMLTIRGYEIFSFSNPMICPLQIKPDCQCNDNQTCTDIIVSDLDMPNMTGLTFIENLRMKNCKCQHVALMSSFWK
jgi:response regulator RpfG family c-di-GMP phosphodiesterase